MIDVDYVILDKENDFSLFMGSNPGLMRNACLIPVSAAAHTFIPDDWPKERLLSLRQLIDHDALMAAVAERRKLLLETIFASEDCPYYIAKKILDTFLEKAELVDRLAMLDGTKYFIGTRNPWVAAEGDTPEQGRIAALFMEATPGFVVSGRQAVPRCSLTLKLIAANGRDAWRALLRRRKPSAPLIGRDGYGASAEFQQGMIHRIDRGSLLVRAIRHLRLRDVLFLLRHNAPVMIAPTPAERSHPYIPVLKAILKRARRVNSLARIAAADWAGAPYFFTVNYGTLAEVALTRALRLQGIPVITMQHACVGHDEWLASQYADVLLSDAKIVATRTVGTELATFEAAANCEYLVATPPIFRGRTETPPWMGEELTYVLTGFVSSNIMYDNRRMNDALYLASVEDILAGLSRRFKVTLKPHPYDERQYGHSIAKYLARRHNCQIQLGGLPACPGALVIDSPSTILADAVCAGRTVFVVNRTAIVRPRFEELAHGNGVLQPDVDALVRYVDSTPVDEIAQAQERFRTGFAGDYLGQPGRGAALADVIGEWLSARRSAGRNPIDRRTS
ncbi:hypothetical protein [Radicibacter daui]|uniref:hypothetical protein n=1 Tax=Radicibacter daui TaxID=3064829 RepID=UPI004046CF32